MDRRDLVTLAAPPWPAPGIAELERRLIALEFAVREAEHRIRKDLLERDRAWRDWMVKTVSLLSRMLAAVASPRRSTVNGRMP